jgi:hypothetical protein
METVLTKKNWLALFGDLKWNNGGGFELTFEPDRTNHYGSVWLQTEGAEEDMHGTSCKLHQVTLLRHAKELKGTLQSVRMTNLKG